MYSYSYAANKSIPISHSQHTHHSNAAVLASFDGGANRVLLNQHRQATINEYFHLMVMENDVRCRRAEDVVDVMVMHGGGRRYRYLSSLPLLLLLNGRQRRAS